MTNLNKPLTIIFKDPAKLVASLNNACKHPKKQMNQLKKSIKAFGFNCPVLMGKNNEIIAGHARVQAAIELGLASIPTISLAHLSPAEARKYMLADNKIAQNSTWDYEILQAELEFFFETEVDFDFSAIGFETPEVDSILNFSVVEESKEEQPEELNFPDIKSRVKSGDFWQLDKHRLYCGDSTKDESFFMLLGTEKADMVFCDNPYNVVIAGNVTTQSHHKEFAQASGEMSQSEFVGFLKSTFELQIKYSKNGALHLQFMDWRHMDEILEAGKLYTELKNLCVWDKITAGMGSLYRSQHELIFIYKNGDAPHQNNVELGANGRYRTNVWKYKGMHASNPDAKDLLKLHPTPKPLELLMDAMLDCSSPNDIILDAFGGSGSTLLAAEKVGRRARLIEIDSHYCDVILYRWEQLTGKKAKFISNVEDLDNE